MILVWFNNNNGCFYTKFYNHYILNNYYVGYKNSYNHEVIQIIIVSDHIYYVESYNDYLKKSSISIEKRYSIFTMFIHKLQEFFTS